MVVYHCAMISGCDIIKERFDLLLCREPNKLDVRSEIDKEVF